MTAVVVPQLSLSMEEAKVSRWLVEDGEAVAAVNLAAHRTMASLDDLVARTGPLMQRTAAEISTQLGYRSPGRSVT